jgi:hypothetical protein
MRHRQALAQGRRHLLTAERLPAVGRRLRTPRFDDRAARARPSVCGARGRSPRSRRRSRGALLELATKSSSGSSNAAEPLELQLQLLLLLANPDRAVAKSGGTDTEQGRSEPCRHPNRGERESERPTYVPLCTRRHPVASSCSSCRFLERDTQFRPRRPASFAAPLLRAGRAAAVDERQSSAPHGGAIDRSADAEERDRRKEGKRMAEAARGAKDHHRQRSANRPVRYTSTMRL